MLIFIVLFMVAMLVMFLLMHISGNNIFEGRKIKDLIVIRKNDEEPLVDRYLILVFIISLGIIIKATFFNQI